MTILLTGGTGKTSSRIARLLLDSSKVHPSHKPLIASRSASKVPEPFRGVTFDWLDDKTWDEPFTLAAADNNPIQAAYLVAHSTPVHSLAIMKSFVDFSSGKHQVKRFVLMTSTGIGSGGYVPAHLQDYVASLGLEFCTLRPTWFMENFLDDIRRPGIARDSVIYSTTNHGRIPWISADDIAEVAFRGLTDEKSHNAEHVLIGREVFSYDEVAARMTEILGRKITHKKLTSDELHKRYKEVYGLDDELAQLMTMIELPIDQGGEEKWSKEKGVSIDEWESQRDVQVVLGKITISEFLEKNKEQWRSGE